MRYLRKVLLVVVLGEEELGRRQDLGGYAAEAACGESLLVFGL